MRPTILSKIPREIKRKVPINWSILRERMGTCSGCGMQSEFKYWKQPAYPFPAIECRFCYKELDITGAVKDYFREGKNS